VERLKQKLAAKNVVQKKRIDTKTPQKAHRARIQDKKANAAKKSSRGNVKDF
jgi:hypothetical protein